MNTTVPLAWNQWDIEQRMGFRGAKFTRVRHDVTFFIAAFLTVVLYAAMIPLDGRAYIVDMFIHRGPTQHAVVFLTLWALLILAFKRSKLKLQRQSLHYLVLPDSSDFTLSVTTTDQVMPRMLEIVDDPACFVLYNRILVAISNLRNLGRVGDVEEILRSQASQDESSSETSYAMLQGLIWAIPVLGFIGTVLGLSTAIGQFGGLLQSAADLAGLKDGMRNVTAGLSTAFETTLVALVAALAIQLLLVMTKKSEEEFLDECSEYCTRHIVGRLRVLSAEQSQPETPWAETGNGEYGNMGTVTASSVSTAALPQSAEFPPTTLPPSPPTPTPPTPTPSPPSPPLPTPPASPPLPMTPSQNSGNGAGTRGGDPMLAFLPPSGAPRNR